MKIAHTFLCLALSLMLPSMLSHADDHKGAPSLDAAGFETMMKEISNWGRWGQADQLGTLNLITAAKKAQAATLVRSGVSVSLALPMNKVSDHVNEKPFKHTPFIFPSEPVFGIDPSAMPQAAGDVFEIDYHGFAHSHLDAINHFAYQGKMYNGFVFEQDENGFANLGIENVAREGIVTRGVLVDFPAFFGVDYLQPGRVITTEDFLAWEKASGIKISSGDALIVRTGRWEAVADREPWNFVEAAAGLHASTAKFLKERDVAVIGCDGVTDVMPSGVGQRFNPTHELLIIGLGMPIFDNLDLAALTAQVNKEKRPVFMLVAAPLNVAGASGSPLNPLAIF